MLSAIPGQRTFRANAFLAVVLCATAGALNAGGFYEFAAYTSHVSGSVARIGNELATGHVDVALRFAAFVFAFFCGAMTSTLLIEHNLGETQKVRYVKPLVLELVLVIVYVLAGTIFDGPRHLFGSHLGVLLSFTMGLQNAMVTKISGAVVRTTHMTGVVTDFGMEVVRLSLLLRDRMRLPENDPNHVDEFREFVALMRKESKKAALHLCMLSSFGAGALAGAISFVHWGYMGAMGPVVLLSALTAIELYLLRIETLEMVEHLPHEVPGARGRDGSCESERIHAASKRLGAAGEVDRRPAAAAEPATKTDAPTATAPAAAPQPLAPPSETPVRTNA